MKAPGGTNEPQGAFADDRDMKLGNGMEKNFSCRRGSYTIRGTEFRCAEGKLPALILSHGYLCNRKMCRAYAELAADLGYAAYTFDFNGGGLGSESSGKSTEMTVLTEVEDLKAVFQYVSGLEGVDTGRISLLGCSQGGVVSAITAKTPGMAVHSLILFYPALCIPDDARAGKMMFARFDPANIPQMIQRLPMKVSGEYARCVQNWTQDDIVGGYDGPVLLLHGTADRIVNIRYAREATGKYQDIEYHEIAGGEHMFRGKHEEEAQAYLRTFLTRQK